MISCEEPPLGTSSGGRVRKLSQAGKGFLSRMWSQASFSPDAVRVTFLLGLLPASDFGLGLTLVRTVLSRR